MYENTKKGENKMKKIIAILLTISIIVSFAACGSKSKKEEVNDVENIVETNKPEDAVADKETTEDKQEDKAEDKADKETTKNPVTAQTQKPAVKPQTEQKPAEKPTEKPEAEKQPEQKPADKPVETPTAPETTTLGKTLLADFKAKAASGMNAQAIADGLLANPAIKFGGGAMPVEEGLLSGFDNAEIKGFKSGVMFAPMIGSIPFVGYIFELENTADIPSFIANLEKNANRRWNICVEADEMVTGSSGNKVFFVMCPTSLDE